MGYVPERITDYPQEIDDRPLHVDAEKLAQAVEQYYEDPIGVKVALAIASFADGRGVAFPSVQRLSNMTGYTFAEVSRAVYRLQALGVLTIKRRRFTNSKHSHNEYRFRKDFVHQVADKCSSHFLPNVLKWKAKAQDVAAAVVRHASDTVVNTVSSMASKIAEVVQAHPEKEEEFLSHPEKAAQLAGYSVDGVSSVKPADTVLEPAQENTSASAPVTVDLEPVADRPVEWENGGDSYGAPVVKQETNLTMLPANTANTIGPANIQPVQPDMANAPKFINGEVSALWETQQLLHEINPTMYPAY